MRPVGQLRVPALYANNGIALAWAELGPWIMVARPPIVMLHAHDSEARRDVQRQLRAAVPGVVLWIGLGWNGVARKLRAGSLNPTQAADMALAEVKAAERQGCAAVIFNCERGEGEDLGWIPEPEHRELFSIAARETQLAVRAAYPGLVLGFTSHDRPDYHALDWSAWLGPGAVWDLHLPQIYPAPCTRVESARTRRLQSDRAWAKLLMRSVIAPRYAPGGHCLGAYVQGAHVIAAGLCEIARDREVCAVWCEHLDDQGRAFLTEAVGP